MVKRIVDDGLNSFREIYAPNIDAVRGRCAKGIATNEDCKQLIFWVDALVTKCALEFSGESLESYTERVLST